MLKVKQNDIKITFYLKNLNYKYFIVLKLGRSITTGLLVELFSTVL